MVIVVVGWLLSPERLRAQDIVALPGFTWGEVRYPSSIADEAERKNGIVEGALQQGIDWVKIGDFMWLNTFVHVGFKRDTEGLDYNNEIKVGPGIKARLLLQDWLTVGIGGRYDWEYRYKTGDTNSGLVGLIDWSVFWRHERQESVAGKKPAPLAYVLTSWGELRYPSALAGGEQNNLIIEGSVTGGLDWWRITDFAVLNTFAELKYKADTKKFDYNNELEPGVGSKIVFNIGGGDFNVGVKYVYDYRFRSGLTEDGVIFFADWSIGWDLL
jgi:hypothetical protein